MSIKLRVVPQKGHPPIIIVKHIDDTNQTIDEIFAEGNRARESYLKKWKQARRNTRFDSEHESASRRHLYCDGEVPFYVWGKRSGAYGAGDVLRTPWGFPVEVSRVVDIPYADYDETARALLTGEALDAMCDADDAQAIWVKYIDDVVPDGEEDATKVF